MKQPSPLELMAFVDDELDELRTSEVAGWLAAHPDEAAALTTERAIHQLTGEVGRARFVPPASFDLSDAIMAAIAHDEAEVGARKAPVESGPQPIRRAPAEVTPLAGGRAPLAPLASRRAASRSLMVFGALAAAASLLWWRSSGPAVAYAPETSAATATALVASVLPADEEMVIGDDGAAITSVDFGAQSGAIFYVPGTSAASAVVWVDDKEATP